MALTFATADAALKEDYQDVIREQLNDAHMLLNQVETTSKDVEGRRAVLSLHVSRNSGVGARAEGGTLPTAGNQGYTEERVTLKNNYGRIQLSGPILRAMKSDKGSFTRALDSEVKGIVRDLKQSVNRQLYGTGNGVIATCGTTSASATIVLAATTSAVQLRQLAVGTVVDIGTVASPTSIATARTITAVNPSTPSITVSGATVSTTSAAFVFQSGSGGVGVELTGLQAIVAASGTLFNVDPTTVPTWASTVDSNSGTNRAATEGLFAKVMDEVQIASGADLTMWLTTDGVSRGFAAQLYAQKRFANTIELKGGFSGIGVSSGRGEIALTWDKDCPSNTAFGLTAEHLFQHQSSDWEFMNEDGAVLSRVPNQDAYEATLFKYHELTTDQRNAHARISDLTEA